MTTTASIPTDRVATALACAGCGLIAALSAVVGVESRATYGAQTSADEPYYLITALSLVNDGNLDIDDEIANDEFRSFHEIRLNEQTEARPGGQQLSPHDPLLPALLVPGMALGDWRGAKVNLALFGGLMAAVTAWVAIVRLGLRRATTVIVVGGLAAAMPLSAYGTHVYPEIPAACAVVCAVAALTASGLHRRHLGVVVIAVVVLPWLSVKFVPVAGVLALLAMWRRRRDPDRVGSMFAVGALLVAGVAYLIAHQRIYGGWTVYAAGDHFVETGEFSVVGVSPDYLGRSRRLIGLIVDRDYGLGSWTPLWFLLPASVAVVLRDRSLPRAVLVLPVLAGWLTATFLALTMHGWWSPGRQVVVVLPLAVLAIAATVDRFPRLLVPAVLLAAGGVVNWLVLAREAATGGPVLIVDFDESAAPVRAIYDRFLPDGRTSTLGDDVGLIVWAVILVGSAIWAARTAGSTPRSRATGDQFDDASGAVSTERVSPSA